MELQENQTISPEPAPQQVNAPPQSTPAYSPPPPAPVQAPPVPVNNTPMKVHQFVLMLIIQALPIIGIIMTFVWAFGSKANVNKRNLCRAQLILLLVGIVIFIVSLIGFGTAMSDLFNNIQEIGLN